MKNFFSFKLTDPREFPLMMKGQLQGWFSGQFNTVTNSQLSGLTAPLSHNKAAAALTHLLTSPPAARIREYPGLVALLRKTQSPRSSCNRLPLASCWLMPEPITWQGHGTTVRAQTPPEGGATGKRRSKWGSVGREKRESLLGRPPTACATPAECPVMNGPQGPGSGRQEVKGHEWPQVAQNQSMVHLNNPLILFPNQ